MSRARALVVATGVAAGSLVVSMLASLPGLLATAVLPTALGLAVLITASELAFVGVAYAFTRTGDGEHISVSWGLPGERGWLLVGAGTVVTVAVNRLAFAVAARFGVDPVATVQPPDGLSAAGLLAVAPVLLFVVGPAEEYLFRGVLQPYLKGAFTTAGAVVATAVLFTLVHLPSALQVPAALPVSGPVWFAVGVAFGVLAERSETLVVPALVHGLYDVAVFTLLFAEWGLL